MARDRFIVTKAQQKLVYTRDMKGPRAIFGELRTSSSTPKEVPSRIG